MRRELRRRPVSPRTARTRHAQRRREGALAAARELGDSSSSLRVRWRKSARSIRSHAVAGARGGVDEARVQAASRRERCALGGAAAARSAAARGERARWRPLGWGLLWRSFESDGAERRFSLGFHRDGPLARVRERAQRRGLQRFPHDERRENQREGEQQNRPCDHAAHDRRDGPRSSRNRETQIPSSFRTP